MPKYFYFILFSLFVTIQSYCSHIVGYEIKYTYINDSTYFIDFVLYRDCTFANNRAFSKAMEFKIQADTSSKHISSWIDSVYFDFQSIN